MILESLRAAMAFLPRAWGRPWFGIVVVAVAAGGFASLAVADPINWMSPAIIVATLFLLPLIQGPLYALALDEPEPGVAAGASRYVRLVVVGILTDIFLAIPGLLIFVVGLGAAYGMAYANPGFNPVDVSTWTASGPVMVGSTIVLGIGGLALLWLSARVALGPAATVTERRVLMLSTWPLTRGKAWRLVVGRLLVSICVVVIVIAASMVVRALAPASAGRIVPILGGVLVLGLRPPLKVGLLSYFYRHRSPLPVT